MNITLARDPALDYIAGGTSNLQPFQSASFQWTISSLLSSPLNIAKVTKNVPVWLHPVIIGMSFVQHPRPANVSDVALAG